MRCGDVQDLASAFIDGELDDARASALRGHLRQCPACTAAVRELGAIRDAAANLDTLEPSPALWSAVQRRLAEAEIADARRSRLWLHWQALRQTWRPRLLPAAVAMAATASVVLWLWRLSPQSDTLATTASGSPGGPTQELATADPVVTTGATGSAATEAGPAMANETSWVARAQEEIDRADARYTETLAELRALVESERSRWSADAAARLDARLAALTAEARQHLHTAAVTADPDAPDPRSRDALYAVYREEIELLQNVALHGVETVASLDGPLDGQGALP
jgi:anti-sigma factor RsiW